MGNLRAIVILAGLLGVASGQQEQKAQPARPQGATMLELGAPMSRYEVAAPQEGGVQAAERFVRVLSRLLESSNAGAPTVQLLRRPLGVLLLVRGDGDHLDLARRVLEGVQKDEPVHARVQCSFVTLPLAVAAEHGLKAGVVVPTDEAAIGKLVKEATKNKGTLLNVPEVAVRPLTPFVIEATGKAAAPTASQPLRLRGEMVPVGPEEVAIATHLVRGRLPGDATQVPTDALLAPVFRLQAGKAAMIMVAEGETATVLIVRCAEVAAAPLRAVR